MAKNKICGACGAGFECGAPSRTCWCESVKVSAETLASLRERFGDCLCPRCLEQFASSNVPVSRI
jgi:hypothetical protein